MPESTPLVALAHAVGLVTGYRATDGRWIEPPESSLLATLQAYGLDLDSVGQAEAMLAEIQRQRHVEVIAPVAVAWNGCLQPLTVRGVRADATELRLESGETWRPLPVRDGQVILERVLPLGRHELVVTATDTDAQHRSVIFSSPTVAWRPAAGAERRWGIFAPTYALRRSTPQAPTGDARAISDRSDIGDLGDLEAAFDWLHARGGHVVMTLPMLATFLDEPAEISPYAPVSRRFWNELFADVSGLAAGADASAVSPRGLDNPDRFDDELVDYRGGVGASTVPPPAAG